MSKNDLYYKAMLSRDYRFDGKFFVGVKTTGIYCRPICPAKPKRENVEFFKNHIDAEKAGFRPCMRCRPESAPHSPAWIGKSAVVQRAIRVLNSSNPINFNEDCFADQFGVSSRHLRRLFVDEVGKTPKQIAFENRLNLSRKLILETSLPLSRIAFASGFDSIRRFNDAFKERFKKVPSKFRTGKVSQSGAMQVSLSYRPPFDFEGLMKTYASHRVGNLERVENGKLSRIIAFNDSIGKIEISNNLKSSELILEIDFPDTAMIFTIISKVRAMFDLDSDPVAIANALETDPQLKNLIEKYPGIRLPSGWDPFEIAISAILGQLVSVERGRSLVSDLIDIAGTESGFYQDNKPIKLFPTPQQIVDADLGALKTTKVRKQTLKEFSNEIANKRISLHPAQDVESFRKDLLKIRGIGPWTAHYIALKAIKDTDAFPTTDLILSRFLKEITNFDLKLSSPWRGYVAALIWRHHSDLPKEGRKK